MTGDGLVEWLSVGETTEMEGRTPAIFVEVGREVVITVVGT
jgi:hypothetical protein